ncbi:hypothetical protein AcW1_005208 [Taiwanofungus camphoratus]|nr:hypothetical protein AcW1_005208 [Antrodia cinnamomea]
MSRRQSRVSIDVRQNDTLLEFENFKKKFLLANKHITKLNSTLSVRIEELNAQISTLYVENLRLRASEIALASQLKRERERSRKIIADAEAATHSLVKHLGHIRKSFNISHGRSSSPEEPPSASPRAKRRVPDPSASPPPNRLARPPTIPGIYEDDETNMSSPEDLDADVEEEEERSPTPARKKKAKPRSSDSRLPIPTRVISPPPSVDLPQINFDEKLSNAGKRKPTRRQSGLLTSMSITTVTRSGISTEVVPTRPPSPAFGPPLRKELKLVEDEEVIPANGDEEQEVEVILQSVARREKKEKRKEREKERVKERDPSADTERRRERERKRLRGLEEPVDVPEGSKSKLKDVTNSQGSHPVLPTLDTASATRTFLSMPAQKLSSNLQSLHLPTPRASSPVLPAAASETELVGGRERRVRKSINYAEPKLNTKMRKPDPTPTTTTSKPRSSTSSSDGSSSQTSPEATAASQPSTIDGETSALPIAGVKRKKSRAYVFVSDEESEGTQADAEYGGESRGSSWINEGRRRSVQGSSTLRRIEGDDTRRHSMAV